jgi:hypothetical protein
LVGGFLLGELSFMTIGFFLLGIETLGAFLGLPDFIIVFYG